MELKPFIRQENEWSVPTLRLPCTRTQGHRKVDEAVKILLTANSGEERLAMKSGFFESAPVGS